jgi:cyclase
MRTKWGILALTLLAAGGFASAQTLQGGLGGDGIIPGVNPNSPVKVLPVRGNIYMLTGAGANITASIGLDGVLLVDSGTERMAEPTLAAIRAVQQFVMAKTAATAPPVLFGEETRNSVIEARNANAPPKPIRYILSTSAGAENTGGNIPLRNAGGTFTGGNVAGQLGDLSTYGAKIVAHENVQTRLLSPGTGRPAMLDRGVPTDTYYGAMMKMDAFFNGEGIVLFHQPKAFSDGDSIVQFRGSDVIATGNIYSTVTYPMIDVPTGGTINGVLDGLNNIIDLMVPEFRTEGGTLAVPAYGRISDLADVAYYRDMVTIIRDRVQDLMKKGQTFEQIKAAKPTSDYEGRFGATSGAWTTDMFLDAVYKTLPKPAAPAPARRNGRTE